MSEDTSDLSLQIKKGVCSDTIRAKNDSSQSLLSIVHDKNKTIERLQRQLHFQKMQLKFYLGKTFSDTKMIGFSKTCHSQAVEENLPVTLAVNRFNKQTGHKSKIINLYDRMCCIDGRISGLLHVQECFLRKVIGKICEFAKSGNELDVQMNYRKMLNNPEYMSVFNNLIHANIGLKKSLDTFRICCDRLIVVEEERSSIGKVQLLLTYSNVLTEYQIEKVQLQNRMKEILKDQILLRNRVDELSDAEEQLRKLQEEYKTAFKTSTEHVTGMLRKVNNEALGLVEKSNQQREKYTKEIIKLKSENYKISKLLEKLKVSIRDKVMSKDSIKLDSIYSAGLFQALDKEITQAIRENEMNKSNTIQKARSECKELTNNLHCAQNQNILLTKELDALRTEYDKVKQQWTQDLEAVQRERDDYRSQVEDLQAIRSAYAQLAESRGDVMADGEKGKRELEEEQGDRKKLEDLEQENFKLSHEVTELREEVNKQKSKIVRLSGIIVNMGGNEQKAIEVRYMEMKDIGSGDVGNESKTKIAKTKSCKLSHENGDLEKGIIIQELPKSSVNSKNLIQLIETRQLDEITSKILQGLSSTECHCGSSSYTMSDSLSKQSREESNQQLEASHDEHSMKVGYPKSEESNKTLSTTFEIQSSHRNGKTDTIKGILEGRRMVEGTLKMGETSLLSVKVKCLSPRLSINEASRSKQDGTGKREYDFSSKSPTERSPRADPSVRTSKLAEAVSFEEQNYVSTKKDTKSVQVTYRNYMGSRMTDSESQCSLVDGSAEGITEDIEDQHEASTELIDEQYFYQLKKFGTEAKVKSLSYLD